jgi:carboxylate-amine ligase
MHQSVVEVGTNICKMFMKPKIKFFGLKSLSWQPTRFDCGWQERILFKWQDQPITDDPRYHMIVNEMQDAARSI